MNDYPFSTFQDKLQWKFDTKISMLSTQNQTFFFFPKGQHGDLTFLLVFIVALRFFQGNKTWSHLFGSSPNQTSAGKRSQLWSCCEFTVSSLFNSLVMSQGKMYFRSSCQEAITLCSSLTHHKSHSK